jgi:O-methyltransferase involved in polyketide biosynthesis
VLAPVDFERQSLRDGLDAAGFDPSQQTLFSWLGVAPYLTVEAIKATLRWVADCAPGSEIVFDYLVTDEYWDGVGRRFVDTFGAIAADAGEPVGSALSPVYAETLVDGCGLAVSEHLDRDDLTSRYIACHGDGLAPLSCIRLITATRRELT